MKKTLLIGVFALASIAFASGKTYNVTLSKPAKVGSLQLLAGNYQLKVDGANAVFTDAKRHSFSTTVKVENGAKKFEYTAGRRIHRNRRYRAGPLDHLGRIRH